MFTFSILVSIVQDKDLELSYCVLSVRMIGSSQISCDLSGHDKIFKACPCSVDAGSSNEV